MSLVLGWAVAAWAAWGAPPPTAPIEAVPLGAVVVLPLETEGTLSPALGEALAAGIRERLLSAGVAQLFHPLQVEPVRQRHRLHFADFTQEAEAQALGERLGADWVVTGRIERGGPGLTMVLTARAILEVDVRSATLEAASPGEMQANLQMALAELWPAAAANLRGPLKPAPIVDQEIYLAQAEAARILGRQRISLVTRIALSPGELTRARAAATRALAAEGAAGWLALVEALSGNSAAARRWAERAPESSASAQLATWLSLEPKAALAYLATRTTREPNALWWRELWVDTLLNGGDWAGAEAALSAAPAGGRRQPGLLRRWAALERGRGHVEEALEWQERAVRLSPDDPELVVELAELLFVANRPEEAADLIERPIADPWTQHQAWFLASALAEFKRQPGAAAAALEQILDTPNNDESWQAQGRARTLLALIRGTRSGSGRALLQAAAEDGYFDRAALLNPGPERPEPSFLARLERAAAKSPRRPHFKGGVAIDPATGRPAGRRPVATRF